MDTNCDRVKRVLRKGYVFWVVAGNTAAFTNPSHRGSDLCLEIPPLLGEPHFVCFVPEKRDKDNLSFSPPRRARRVGLRTKNPFHGFLADPDFAPLRLEA